jgi:hypothetical protein
MAKQKSIKVKLPEFRMSYPSLFKPKLNDLNDKLEYSCVALFPLGADLSVLETAIKQAFADAFGPNEAKWPREKSGELVQPLKDQSDRAKVSDDGKKVLPAGYVAGAKYLNLKTTQKPGVVDAQVQPIVEASEIYGGCYGMATVTVYAYKHPVRQGVTVSLQNVQKTRDGEKFGGAVRAEDDFAPLPAVSGDASSLFN